MSHIAEQLKLSGRLVIEVTGPDGGVKHRHEVPNLVVTTGRDFVASRMKDATATVMTHMALGSSGTAAALGDTALGTELGRVALTSTVVVANVITYTATFPAGTATGAVVEAGLFNAGAAGTMLARTVFAVINKGALDAMTVSWAVTVS